MSKKAKGRKKLSRYIKSRINEQFYKMAVSFITDIFTLENKTIPRLLSKDDIQSVYTKTLNRINNELMWHRNKPIAEEKLQKLKQLDSLPKSTKTILESLFVGTNGR